jgi:hypothetical protein
VITPRERMRNIVREVCTELGVGYKDVMDGYHGKKAAQARHEAIRRCRNNGFRLRSISQLLGLRTDTVAKRARQHA